MLRPRLLVAAGLFAACLAGASPARAGIVLGGGTVRVVGDPSYEYNIQVLLDPGNTMNPAPRTGTVNPLDQGTSTYLTFFNVPGFTNYVGTFKDQAGSPPPLSDFNLLERAAGTGYVPTGVTPPTPVSGASDLTFYEVKGSDPIVNNTASPILLGWLRFRINLDDGIPPPLTLSYTSQALLNGTTTTTTGTVEVRFVPEPGSVVALIIGGTTVLGYGALRKRRKPVSAA